MAYDVWMKGLQKAAKSAEKSSRPQSAEDKKQADRELADCVSEYMDVLEEQVSGCTRWEYGWGRSGTVGVSVRVPTVSWKAGNVCLMDFIWYVWVPPSSLKRQAYNVRSLIVPSHCSVLELKM